ncbi:MAG: outer membrane protein assembly factor BamA [candidate division WOR-3 bacterium]
MIGLLFLFAFPYGEVITEVSVKGVKEVDTSLVIRSSGLQIGEILTREEGIEAIKALYGTGFFSDIKLDAKRKGGGVEVIIEVEENPRLKSLNFEGNKKIKDGEISSCVDLSPPALLSEYKLHRIKGKIYDLYKEKGFTGTEISISKEVEEDGVNVTFVIKEGEKYKVKKINFIGNKVLSGKKLSKVLSNKTKRWWTFWRDNSLKVDSLEADVPKIEAFYRNHGFLNARVDSFYVEYENNNAIINYLVEEGRTYYFGKTNIEGKEDPNFVLRKIKWKEGNLFSEEKIKKTVEDLSVYYSDFGYLNPTISPNYNIVEDSIVDIEFYVDKGNPVYVRYINVVGNDKTYDKVIRRNIVIYPGEIFQRNKVMHSYRNVFRLDYFSDIKIDMEFPTSDSIDLILKVTEKPTGYFSGSIAYSGSIGLTGGLNVTIPNFNGTGQVISGAFEKSLAYSKEEGKYLRNMSFSWTQPWLFDTPTSFGFSLYNTYWERASYYSVKEAGSSISLGRILNRERNLTSSLTYRLERQEVYASGEYKYLDSGLNWESSLYNTLVYDSRDSKIAPTIGDYYSIGVKYAGGILKGDRQYHKIILEGRKFKNIFAKELVIMNRTRIGYALGREGKEVPLLERFLLGGVGEWGVRGYDNEVIVPDLSKKYIGGNFAFLNNLELRLNFADKGYGMIFLDAGNCFKDLKEVDMTDLYYGVGIGFRVEIPMMGIIGVDFGCNLNLFEGKRRWKPHFQLGTTF